MDEPLVVVLVLLLLIGVYAPSAVFAGVLAGYGVRRLGDNVSYRRQIIDLVQDD
ncbi:MAG: hypothetical protein Q4A69_00645 [Moraxella sp.]|nr:hypothetical protein [Moraxella sp.]